MERLKEIIPILDEIEELTNVALIKFQFFSDQSGAFISAELGGEEYLFQFFSFDEIETKFIEWKKQREEGFE